MHNVQECTVLAGLCVLQAYIRSLGLWWEYPIVRLLYLLRLKFILKYSLLTKDMEQKT
jgi:hypothetical protein